MPVCQIQLLFHSPANKQLFLSFLQPGLTRKDTADHSYSGILEN